ncbi:phosphoadenosine phosphosulfate reductase [Betaproteobacteria bacterium]|nr:phosphoadenosine phosphosulfate reductase [Betaproteobacteria bacterium]GHU00845.1 phosphoadenosine phosphosulfate reductase [Betaproteobacteria bacterium]GHU15874.1 phosphoadenosine phosphosulfate reductase [Betaproteobacteria bacterium]
MNTLTPLTPAPVANPAIRPELSDALRTAVAEKAAAAQQHLSAAVREFGSGVVFANSLGAEDVVLTDLIHRAHLPIAAFLLDTGRLPAETYTLLAELEARYHVRLALYFPAAASVEAYVREHGINAFHESVELRKACCQVRKLEPLARALDGKRAWITGLRAAQSSTRSALAAREHDPVHHLVKFNPLAEWSETEVWAYIRAHDVPYNALHEQRYPSIGCTPCTRAITRGEDIRAGRWWWEDATTKECGLHARKN